MLLLGIHKINIIYSTGMANGLRLLWKNVILLKGCPLYQFIVSKIFCFHTRQYILTQVTYVRNILASLKRRNHLRWVRWEDYIVWNISPQAHGDKSKVKIYDDPMYGSFEKFSMDILGCWCVNTVKKFKIVKYFCLQWNWKRCTFS